jgi:propanediol dehydratase large subunit
MPIPAGFDNTVRYVNAVPVAAADLNAEIATQNAASFWMTDLKFVDNNNALLLFVKTDFVTLGYTAEQKVNLVALSQAAIDADKATEIAGGYWPTGIFPAPDGRVFILYQLLDPPPLP